MLFYVQMRWNYQGRISQDQLWDLEALEGQHGVEGIRAGFVQLYKVVSQHRIIAIVNSDSLENLDRNSMGWLPMREYLEFEQVWALRDYEGFLEDVKAKFPPRDAVQPQPARPAAPARTPTSPAEEMTRKVVGLWFDALRRGDGAAALDCVDDNVVWINSPPDKGLSDIVTWLGEYHGRKAVEGIFVIWGQLSQVKQMEVRNIVFDGDEAFAIVHEVATIKATGLDYDIEFIQRIRVANDRIVFWKSYWDTSKGIVAFRGDMRARLTAAAQRNDRDEAMKVLPFGADPNTIDSASSLTVLMIAAGRGHVEMVRTLLEFGADPNTFDRRAGTAPLHKACQGGHLAVVKLLVEAGAHIDLQATTTGHTPLVEAIWFKSDDIVAYLIERNARIELKTYYGFTLDDHINYAVAVSQGQDDQRKLARIKDLVAERRARDARARDARAREAARLIAAVQKKSLDDLTAALQAGAKTEERYPIIGSFDDGHTPLLVAARDGQTDMAIRRTSTAASSPTSSANTSAKVTYCRSKASGSTTTVSPLSRDARSRCSRFSRAVSCSRIRIGG